MAAATQDATLTADPLLYRLPEFPSAIPITPGPAMSPRESEGIAAWVTISGVPFPAMVLGGEPRVPIHLLLSRVLFTQGVSEIQAMMDDLNIHKSIATNEQAESLRKMDAEVSGTQDMSNLNLVTRSDAERICGIVRIESTPSTIEEPIADESDRLSVQHAMFGTVKGWAYPSRKGGRSVRCQECGFFFTPQDFVAHSHSEKKESQRTVHWGFDPSNWRLMLELAKPSSECSISKERWKEFIDEPTIQSCGISENCDGFSVNKAKRSLIDQSLEVPPKILRINNDRANIEKPLPIFSDPSTSSKLYLSNNFDRILDPKPTDPLALIEEVIRKETAFKVKCLSAINGPNPAGGQLISLEDQPNAVVPHPSTFKSVGEAVKDIQTNCERLEALESVLKRMSSNVSPTITDALSEIRLSLMKGNLAEYERLRLAYEFLFTLYRQLCDPFGYSNDPLMAASVAKMRADHIAMGISADLNDSSRAQALADLSQQQAKLASLDQFGSVPKMPVPLPSFPTAPVSADSQLLQHLFAQQLMQLMSAPQLTQ
uniref:DAF-5 n=1 Tax=Haemonchus contortus TaxID=6289 RepID=A0A6B9D0L7_HAECO|nr:DAF-5 [Haemonchus contortus]